MSLFSLFLQQAEGEYHLGLENILFHLEKNLSLHFQPLKIRIFGKNKGELEIVCCSKWKSEKERLQLLRAGVAPKASWYKLTGFAKYPS